MPDGLYDIDALAWAETQAALLRRLASGERVNEQIDWPNVIEEVGDVGKSELRACESSLIQALSYLLKLRGWPASAAGRHWKEEIGNFLDDAQRSFTPSMRQKIDVSDLYRTSLRRFRRATDDSGEPAPVPEVCPFSLDDLLTGDVDELAVRLSP